MDRKIKSIAVPKKQPIYLIATDGYKRGRMLRMKIPYYMFEGGNIWEGLRTCNKLHPKNSRNKELRVLLSAGNEDISNNKYIQQNIINGKNIEKHRQRFWRILQRK